MRSKIAIVLSLAMLVAGSAFAGEGCSQETQSCLNYLAAKADSKGWLGVEFERHEKGYAITKVVENSPASKAGLMAGDIVAMVNKFNLGEEDGLHAAYELMTPNNKVKLTVLRGHDKVKTMVTFAKMPETVYMQMVGAHMLEHVEKASAMAEEEE